MNRIFILIMVLVVAIFGSACGTTDAGGNGDVGANSDGDTIIVTHPLGETPVPKNPQSVVIFDFSTLDTLDKLGVQVKGLPKTNAPAYLSHYNTDAYENAGGLMEPDFEAVYAMEPDLIIIANRQSEHYDEFSKIGPTILIDIETEQYLESFRTNVTLLGEIFSKEKEAAEELNKIETAIAELGKKVEKEGRTGLIVLTTGGKISAYGPGSRFGILHEAFGFKPADENIEVSTHGMSVSFEYVAEINPDYLFVVDRDAVVEGKDTAQEVIENDMIKNTDAYRNGNIVYLNPNYWYLAGSGLISVNEMIKQIEAVVE